MVAIPLLVLAVNWASLLYLTRAESSDRNSANQAATLTQSGQDALSALLDAETGVRGYLLSGKVSFLQPYAYVPQVERGLQTELTGCDAIGP